MAPFPRAGAVRTVESALGRPIDELFARVRRAGRRRLDRAGAPGAQSATPDGRARWSPSRCCGPACAQRFARDLAGHALRRARSSSASLPDAEPAAPGRGGGNARPLGRDGDGLAPRGRRRCRNWPRTARDDPDFRVPHIDGTDRARSADASNGSTASRSTISPRSRPPATTGRARPAPSSSPSCATPCATASSTPTCTRATCSSIARAGSSRWISASWAGSGQGAAVPGRDPLRLHPPRLPARRRGAFRGRLRAAAPLGRGFRAGDPRDRRADPRPARPTRSRWRRLLTLLFEITALFDMKTRTELVLLQKTMVVVEGVGAHARSASSTCGRPSEPVVRDWIERNLGPRRPASRMPGAELWTLARRRSADLPDLAAAAPSASLDQLEDARARGFALHAAQRRRDRTARRREAIAGRACRLVGDRRCC